VRRPIRRVGASCGDRDLRVCSARPGGWQPDQMSSGWFRSRGAGLFRYPPVGRVKARIGERGWRVRFLTPDAVAAFLDELNGRTPPQKKARGRQASVGEPAPGGRAMYPAEAADFLGLAHQTLAKWDGAASPLPS
jgi:hypothetical protein